MIFWHSKRCKLIIDISIVIVISLVSLQALDAFELINYQTTKYTFILPWNYEAFTDSTPAEDEDHTQTDLNAELEEQSYLKFDDDDEDSQPRGVMAVPLQEGAFCRRSFDGRSGYCVVAYHCLHVIREHRVHGTPIDICTYRNNLPVICCTLENKQVRAQRLSATKCQEYNFAARGLRLNNPERTYSGKSCVPSIPLIVGGTPTRHDLFLHMSALGWTQSNGDIKWGCGGALVSELYVLTAAHCATSGSKPPDMVRLGSKQLNVSSDGQQNIKIQMIILHPKYRSSSHYHDIALLKLTKRAQLSDVVRPACLWQLADLRMKSVVAAGWGRTEFLGSKSHILRQVDLDLINQQLCKKLYRKERRLPRSIIDSQFCAGHLPGGKDTCQGDSGGPLHAILPEYNCVALVVGITSFGKFCAAPNAPGVYTKVYSYLDWIEKIAFKT